MKPLYILLIAVSSISCQQKKQQQVEVITMNNTRPINELKELVLLKGDTAAYDELATAYLTDKYNEEYLLYSLVMANKYNYPRAYFQVYECLTSVCELRKMRIDEKTKALAIKYLKEGAELNERQSVIELGESYLEGKYVPKDTILGKTLTEKGHKLRGF